MSLCSGGSWWVVGLGWLEVGIGPARAVAGGLLPG